jgi:predicted transposase YbfD/YdcC
MNKERCFKVISSLKKSEILALLSDAYDVMKTPQRNEVFHKIKKQSEGLLVDPRAGLKSAKKFLKDSLDGVYYASFDVNSKNFMDVPEETDAWFSKLHDVLASAAKLTEQQDYSVAIEIFKIAYELIEMIESGEEIVFADELGMWMCGFDEKPYERAYLQSLFSSGDEGQFVEVAIKLAKRDSRYSFSNKTYQTIKSSGDKKLISLFHDEAEKRSVPLNPSW